MLSIRALVQTLRAIASLYDIEGGHTYKAIALRKAAETLSGLPSIQPDSVQTLIQLPGVGASTARLIQDILQEGPEQAVAHLKLSVPVSLLEILPLRGVGPKTAKLLYEQLGVTSLADLHRAIESRRLEALAGFGPKKLHQLKADIEALERSRRFIPIALAWPLVTRLCAELSGIPGVVHAEPSGEVRRLVQECAQIECLTAYSGTNPPSTLIDWASARGLKFNPSTQVVHGSLTVDGHTAQVCIYMASDKSFPFRWLWTTSDETHRAVLTGLANQQDKTLEETRLVLADGTDASCANERDIYAQFGLPFYVPELREGRGILCNPSTLLQLEAVRGDLHVHSFWSDGTLSIRDMALAAKQLGYEYIAVTDHSQRLKIAGGLNPEEVLRQKEEILQLNEELQGITILRGIEVDILPDGGLDLPDDILWDLDVVVASIHSHMQQSKQQLTDRVLSAVAHPAVDIIGHMTGRILGRRPAYPVDAEKIIEAAARHQVCLEINANPNRLDISDDILRHAVDSGVWIAINTDAHAPQEYQYMVFGVRMSHRGWVPQNRVLNTLAVPDLLKRLHKGRNSG